MVADEEVIPDFDETLITWVEDNLTVDQIQVLLKKPRQLTVAQIKERGNNLKDLNAEMKKLNPSQGLISRQLERFRLLNWMIERKTSEAAAAGSGSF